MRSALVAILFLAAPASAEHLSVEADPGPHTIEPGTSATLTFDLNFTAGGFACMQGDEFAVTFTSHDTGMSSMPNAYVDEVMFGPGHGIFIEPAGAAYSETQTVQVDLEVLRDAPRGHTMTYSYTADFDGGTSCFGTEQPQRDSVDFSWQIHTGEPLMEEPAETDEPIAEETRSTPAPSLGLLAVVAGALIAARRP